VATGDGEIADALGEPLALPEGLADPLGAPLALPEAPADPLGAADDGAAEDGAAEDGAGATLGAAPLPARTTVAEPSPEIPGVLIVASTPVRVSVAGVSLTRYTLSGAVPPRGYPATPL
jgi:hypothetical protein